MTWPTVLAVLLVFGAFPVALFIYALGQAAKRGDEMVQRKRDREGLR